MSGTGFVQAVVMWLLMLAFGGVLVAAAVWEGAIWALVLMFGLVWAPLTMWWTWLAFRGSAR